MQLTTIKYDTHDICILFVIRVEYYLSIKRICLAILPHSDNSVFHTIYFSFFASGGGDVAITKYSLQTPIVFSCFGRNDVPLFLFCISNDITRFLIKSVDIKFIE